MAKKSTSKKTTKATPAKAKAKAAPLRAQATPMTVEGIFKQLATMKDERMRAHNQKHGAGDNQFGVKLGDLRTLARKIKTNHDLALALWRTGNIDAQLLATLLLQVDQLSASELERMVTATTFVPVAEWLHAYVVKEHPDKESLRQKWMNTTDPMAARAGWRLTAGRIAKNPDGLDPVALLDRLEAEMGAAPSVVQWTMNFCLAEIGIRFSQHRQRAIAIGEKLGLFRDYPVSKGCTSPFAPIWINAMVSRQK